MKRTPRESHQGISNKFDESRPQKERKYQIGTSCKEMSMTQGLVKSKSVSRSNGNPSEGKRQIHV
ncbi:hypothetical protein N7462_005252 [Penicillium macrosclerotiorum]|uniref:uncharacterized protein n=1 Tax=Penicillium macrosclerotiorum TaxID=303699 RepID=UPI0025493B83|nr:uncharacterized protein N7462_005252 [Penicillium macrosclerotiorum]KAJ5690860.1 hypothetical protein N7462_005252 [Penicillium macrosclerotiorum]